MEVDEGERKVVRKFKCVLCKNKSFSKEDYLIQHKKKVHKINWKASDEQIKANSCGQCGKVFRYPSQLAEHVPTHINGTMEKCQLCSKLLKSIRSLKEHLRNVHARPDLAVVLRNK